MTARTTPDEAHGTQATQERTPSWADRGASLVEYALLVALIAVVCVAALNSFGSSNQGLLEDSQDQIEAAVNP